LFSGKRKKSRPARCTTSPMANSDWTAIASRQDCTSERLDQMDRSSPRFAGRQITGRGLSG